MRKFAFGFVIVFLTLTTSFPAQSEQELTFITVDKFPPYAWMQDDKVTGLDVEIIQHLAQRTGITINIDLLPGKRVLKMLQDGSADGGFAAFKTVKRKEYIDYLEPPLHYSVYRLYVRKGDEFAFKNIQDLYGKAVGKNRGFHISEEFSQAEAEKRIHVYDLKSMEQGIEMLIADRIEVIAGNENEIAFTLKKLGMSDKIISLPVPIRKKRGGYLMISKATKFPNKNRVMQQLSETLQEMKEDGTFESIYSKYRD